MMFGWQTQRGERERTRSEGSIQDWPKTTKEAWDGYATSVIVTENPKDISQFMTTESLTERICEEWKESTLCTLHGRNLTWARREKENSTGGNSQRSHSFLCTRWRLKIGDRKSPGKNIEKKETLSFAELLLRKEKGREKKDIPAEFLMDDDEDEMKVFLTVQCSPQIPKRDQRRKMG